MLMKNSTKLQTECRREYGYFQSKLSALTCQNATLHFKMTFRAEKFQVRPNICSWSLVTMEVDNCQNSNFCAVFADGSLCVRGSPECLRRGRAWLRWLLPGWRPSAPCSPGPLGDLGAVASLWSAAWRLRAALLITLRFISAPLAPADSSAFLSWTWSAPRWGAEVASGGARGRLLGTPRVPWAGAGHGWLLGRGSAAGSVLMPGSTAAVPGGGGAGQQPGELAALREAARAVPWCRGSLQREMRGLATASCLRSSHLGCQLWPWAGQAEVCRGTCPSGGGGGVHACGAGGHRAPLPAGHGAASWPTRCPWLHTKGWAALSAACCAAAERCVF